MWRFLLYLWVIILSGCAANNNFAPVEDRRWQPYNRYASTHVVKKGETLYSIAFRYDKDYKQLAALNALNRSYTLKVGQVLSLNSARSYRSNPYRNIKKPSQPALKYQRQKPNLMTGRSNNTWRWPAKGRVAANFYPQLGKKGIDIAGRKGDKVYAAANGVVAYAGSGIAGYGNLIIIKHNNQFLTAYGHNNQINVREGQKVKVGQIIADMGVIDRKYWGVHFEIRKAGQPVNPLQYLRTG